MKLFSAWRFFVAAERNLDAGIPFNKTDWPLIERGLHVAAAFHCAVGIVVILCVTAWGVSQQPARFDEFVRQCESLGGHPKEMWYATKCVTPTPGPAQ